MEISPVSKSIADSFVRTKHYSHRSPMTTHCYGIVINGMVEGVVVYGSPPAMIAKHAFEGRDFELFELTRLVVQTDQKNAASFLVGGSLKLLPSPCAVVSYADTEMGHSGIVYQATNWLYTGATISHDSMYLIDGVRVHPRSLASKGITNPKAWARENGIETVPPMPKHRYFIFVGSKAEKRAMRSKLRYPIIPDYPKSEKTMYDDGPRMEVAVPGEQKPLW